VIFAGAIGMDGAAMQLDKVTHNRQTKSQPSVAPRAAAISLAETLENVRQKIGCDALTRVNHLHLRIRAGAFEAHLTWPPLGVNLMALESRFHTTCCKR
jgi:hypothetical protein